MAYVPPGRKQAAATTNKCIKVSSFRPASSSAPKNQISAIRHLSRKPRAELGKVLHRAQRLLSLHSSPSKTPTFVEVEPGLITRLRRGVFYRTYLKPP